MEGLIGKIIKRNNDYLAFDGNLPRPSRKNYACNRKTHEEIPEIKISAVIKSGAMAGEKVGIYMKNRHFILKIKLLLLKISKIDRILQIFEVIWP